MAIIKTYPLKSTYYSQDKFLISDMQPDSEGNVSGDTKNITFSTLKTLISGGSLTLTTTGTSGASTFDVNTNTLNVPNYASGSGTVTGTGTAGKISKWSTGGAGIEDSIITEQAAAGQFTGAYISVTAAGGGLSTQLLEVNKALIDGAGSTGTNGYVLSSTTVSGDKEVAWVAAALAEEPAFSPIPICAATADTVVGSTTSLYMFKAISQSTMSPNRIVLNIKNTNSSEFISIAIYKGVIADASLFASINNVALSTNGDIVFSLTSASGATPISQGSNLVLAISIKGVAGADTIAGTSGLNDVAIAAINTTASFVDTSWASNINTYSAANTTGYPRRLAYLMY